MDSVLNAAVIGCGAISGIYFENMTRRFSILDVAACCDLTEKLVQLLCSRKGISPADAQLLSMQEYRQQQFDLLADGVRRALDMNALYAAMVLERRNTL